MLSARQLLWVSAFAFNVARTFAQLHFNATAQCAPIQSATAQTALVPWPESWPDGTLNWTTSNKETVRVECGDFDIQPVTQGFDASVRIFVPSSEFLRVADNFHFAIELGDVRARLTSFTFILESVATGQMLSTAAFATSLPQYAEAIGPLGNLSWVKGIGLSLFITGDAAHNHVSASLFVNDNLFTDLLERVDCNDVAWSGALVPEWRPDSVLSMSATIADEWTLFSLHVNTLQDVYLSMTPEPQTSGASRRVRFDLI